MINWEHFYLRSNKEQVVIVKKDQDVVEERTRRIGSIGINVVDRGFDKPNLTYYIVGSFCSDLDNFSKKEAKAKMLYRLDLNNKHEPLSKEKTPEEQEAKPIKRKKIKGAL